MPELTMAARVGDTIAHSPLLGIALTGIAVGLVIGAVVVALTIATGGAPIWVGGVAIAEGATALATVLTILGAVIEGLSIISTLCTATSAAYTFATWLGSKFSASMPTGQITAGAATVFIGEGSPAAARYQDAIKCQEPFSTYMGAMTLGSVICPGVGTLIAAAIVYEESEHTGATIAQGSKTVLTEKKSQSRVGDKTSCGGTITTGCPTVFIGGPPNAEVSTGAEVPWLVNTLMAFIDYLGVVTGLFAGVLGLVKGFLEHGWELALLFEEEGQELFFGMVDASAYYYERHLQSEIDRLEEEARSSKDEQESKEKRERARATAESLKMVKSLHDQIKKFRKKK